MATSKEKLIASAQKLVEKGQYDRAVKEYLRVVAEDDKDVRVWLKIGDLLVRLERRGEAAGAYERVAQHYIDQGFFRKAIAVYKQIVGIDPHRLETLVALADLCRDHEMAGEALVHYELAAASYYRSDRLIEAIAVLHQMVELDANNTTVLIKLAEVATKAQQNDQAISALERAAAILWSQRQLPEFIRVAERLLFLKPNNIALSQQLAEAYLEQKDARRALPILHERFKAAPKDVSVLELLARSFELLGQTSKAVLVLKELAKLCEENRDAERREKAYRHILALVPGEPEATQALRTPFVVAPPTSAAGQVLDQFTAMPSAAAPLSRDGKPTGGSAEQATEVARIHEEAEVYCKYGLNDMAVQHLQQAIAIAPEHIPTRERLWALYEQMGRPGDAVRELLLLYRLVGGQPRGVPYRRELERLDPNGSLVAAAVQALRAPQVATPVVAVAEPVVEEAQELDEEDAEEIVDFDDDVVMLDDAAEDDEDIPLVFDPASPPAARSVQAEHHNYREPEIEDRFGADLDGRDTAGSGFDDPFAGWGDDPDPVPAAAESTALESESTAVVSAPAALASESTALMEHDVSDDRGHAVGIPGDLLDLNADAGEAPGLDLGMNEQLDIGMNEQLDIGMNEQLDIGMNEQLDIGVNEQLDIGMNEPLDAGMNEPLDAGMNAHLDAGMNEPLDAGMNAHLDISIDEQLDTGMNDQLDISIDEELDAGPSAPLDIGVNEQLGAGASALDELSDALFEPPLAATLEEELERSDAYLQQGMVDAARDVLEALLQRHPGHPLVTAKLNDLSPADEYFDLADPVPVEPLDALPEESFAGMTEDLDDVEPVAVPVQEEPDATGFADDAVPGAQDPDTHFELGVAYRDMGLFAEAVAEFNVAMQDPAREAQCHLMLGLLALDQGQVSEAISQLKQGLYVEQIQEADELALYYELGNAYESIADTREALYYFEKVLKREATFRDIAERVERLRTGRRENSVSTLMPDDIDAAFEVLVSDGPRGK